MAKLQLSFACGLYDRMQPLYTGDVKVDGIDLNFIAIDQPRPIFDRMAAGEEFDVAEFSSSEFVQRFATASSPSIARQASSRRRISRVSGWACRC
jgi:4,5-dihydroxyphthalate decarboxylase